MTMMTDNRQTCEQDEDKGSGPTDGEIVSKLLMDVHNLRQRLAELVSSQDTLKVSIDQRHMYSIRTEQSMSKRIDRLEQRLSDHLSAPTPPAPDHGEPDGDPAYPASITDAHALIQRQQGMLEEKNAEIRAYLERVQALEAIGDRLHQQRNKSEGLLVEMETKIETHDDKERQSTARIHYLEEQLTQVGDRLKSTTEDFMRVAVEKDNLKTDWSAALATVNQQADLLASQRATNNKQLHRINELDRENRRSNEIIHDLEKACKAQLEQISMYEHARGSIAQIVKAAGHGDT